MPTFSAALERIAARVPETEVLMIIGTDGIPIEKKVVRADPNLEAVAAELTTLLRASLAAASDTGLGTMKELALVTDRTTTLLVAITPEYFLFASLTRARSWAGRASRCGWRAWRSCPSSSEARFLDNPPVHANNPPSATYGHVRPPRRALGHRRPQGDLAHPRGAGHHGVRARAGRGQAARLPCLEERPGVARRRRPSWRSRRSRAALARGSVGGAPRGRRPPRSWRRPGARRGPPVRS